MFFLVLINVAWSFNKNGSGEAILVLFIIFLSEFSISSIVDNMRGLCQTLAGIALLMSSLNF